MQVINMRAQPFVARRPGVAARVQRTVAIQPKALFGSATAGKKFYDFDVKDIDGKSVSLASFKGKVVLVVNLASQCGFTPQYSELQDLYSKYSSKGFTVLGFPCNQFGAQEPGPESSIKKFALSTYGVKFPLMSKVDVNGPGAAPVFDWLKSQKGGLMGNDIKWNFSKFLVDKEGNVVGRYASTTAPKDLAKEIEKLL